MAAPKPSRQRANLSPGDRATLEEAEARVSWQPALLLNREAREVDPPGEPVDHGTQPYEPGPSLMDRERRGHFTMHHTFSWSGGVQFSASDGTNTVEFMLDRRQIETLIEATRRWHAGRLQDWLTDPTSAAPACPTCSGSGLTQNEF